MRLSERCGLAVVLVERAASCNKLVGWKRKVVCMGGRVWIICLHDIYVVVRTDETVGVLPKALLCCSSPLSMVLECLFMNSRDPYLDGSIPLADGMQQYDSSLPRTRCRRTWVPFLALLISNLGLSPEARVS